MSSQIHFFFSAFLRLDEKLYRHCVNELHPYNVGPQIILDESHVWVEFNLSMITDPSDPLYEDERRELCYYAPITMSYTRDWERTVRDMHKDYLDPIIVSVQKCETLVNSSKSKSQTHARVSVRSTMGRKYQSQFLDLSSFLVLLIDINGNFFGRKLTKICDKSTTVHCEVEMMSFTIFKYLD